MKKTTLIISTFLILASTSSQVFAHLPTVTKTYIERTQVITHLNPLNFETKNSSKIKELDKDCNQELESVIKEIKNQYQIKGNIIQNQTPCVWYRNTSNVWTIKGQGLVTFEREIPNQ